MGRAGGRVDDVIKVDESKLSWIDRLGVAYCRLNGYEWDDILGPKPEGFDELPVDSPKAGVFRKHIPCKRDFTGPACYAIKKIIGEANASRCWWVYKLGRTEEAWFRWYTRECFKEYFEANR